MMNEEKAKGGDGECRRGAAEGRGEREAEVRVRIRAV